MLLPQPTGTDTLLSRHITDAFHRISPTHGRVVPELVTEMPLPRSSIPCHSLKEGAKTVIHAPRPLRPQVLQAPFPQLLLYRPCSPAIYVNTSDAHISTQRGDAQTLPYLSPGTIDLNHRLPVDDNDPCTRVNGNTDNVESVSIVEHQMRSTDRICSYLMDVFRDLDKCTKFLKYRDEAAQCLVNFLQTLLDRTSLSQPFRTIVFAALLGLSSESNLYPQCFTLTDVIREGDHPVTGGHCGDIYKGRFRDRVVCLKVVRLYTTSDHARACLYNDVSREALLWGQLSHTNVLPFYGIFQLGDTHNRIGLVSPWMQHGNINEFLEKNPDTDRQFLVSDVASGMLYLHHNGIVHGDLKGVNILVTDSKRACLVDFGLSSVTTTHDTKLSRSSVNSEGGQTTDRFQAPELFDLDCERPRSEASDVYAFAMVCYEIFAGRPPFSEISRDFIAMLKVSKGERPERPLGPLYSSRGLNDTMWRLMEECWSQLPEDRLTASQIMLRLPRNVVDPRAQGGWDAFPPSRFKASQGCGNAGWYDALMADALHYLKALLV